MAHESTSSGTGERRDASRSHEVTDAHAAEAEHLASDAPATDTERDAEAAKVVDRFSLWAGGASLIPLPIVDLAAIAGVQIQMLRRLSQIYGVPFSENIGKSAIAGIAGVFIPASTTVGIVSTVKAIPVLGTAVAALSMPALSAGATYIIGKVFIQHFASGGTLLDFNPPDYRDFIKAQAEKLSSRSGALLSSKRTAGTSSAEKGTAGSIT